MFGEAWTAEGMSVTPLRRRMSPEESRAAALGAARELLVEVGPQAVTLKAVGARIGRTHANLLHHFGSAEGLQKALIEDLASRIVRTIKAAVIRSREAEDPAEVVDLTFDAFGRNGAGALASWMILTGNENALDPILNAIHDLVEELAQDHDAKGAPMIREETLQLVLMALGDALLGAPMAKALGLTRDTARHLARRMLLADRGR